MLITLKYSEYKDVAGFAGTLWPTTPSYIVFQSSIYDPNFGLGGSQPRGYDQLDALYGKYRCYGFKYDIRIWNIDCPLPFQVFVQHTHRDVPVDYGTDLTQTQ